MNILKIVHDKDVFPNPKIFPPITNWKDRPTGKVVLLNNKQEIALVCNKVNNYFLLPGGGIENWEKEEQGAKRECREETGCEIELLDSLGITEDYRLRDSKHCINFGYIARVTSYGNQILTENEKDIGVFIRWYSYGTGIGFDIMRLGGNQSRACSGFQESTLRQLRDTPHSLHSDSIAIGLPGSAQLRYGPLGLETPCDFGAPWY